MNRLACFYVIVSFLMFPFYNQALGDSQMNANPDAIMIQWDSEGGVEKPMSGTADLAVFTDGRVEVGPRFANGRATTHKLSEAELTALCRFVFEQQDIWSIDSDELEREVKAVGRSGAASGSHAASVEPLGPEAVADAATTIIRVRDGDQRHEIRYYNLAGAAQRYPQLAKLQRLRAIERRLVELAQHVAAAR